MYIISPVAVFLAARGLLFLERRFASPDGLRWRLLTPSTIITCIIILYVSTGFYLLQAGDFLRRGAATVFFNEYQENEKRNTIELVKWLGENYSGNEVALMGEGEWWHMVEGMNTLRFPYRMGNVNGIWRVLPVSSGFASVDSFFPCHLPFVIFPIYVHYQPGGGFSGGSWAFVP